MILLISPFSMMLSTNLILSYIIIQQVFAYPLPVKQYCQEVKIFVHVCMWL